MLNSIKKKYKYIIVAGALIICTVIAIVLIGSMKSKGSTSEIDSEEVIGKVDETVEIIEPIEEPIIEPVPEPKPEPIPEPEPEPIGPNSKLTALPIHQEAYDRRPIGIMISNIRTALPQYGVSDADIIYETLVEGGITRLFALYQDFDTEKIGPVRSSRHYYLDFALDHDAIYVHFGESTFATAAFRKLDVDRFSGLSYLDTILTFRDKDRKAPHSTFTSKERLMNTWDLLKYRVEPDYEENKFDFYETDTTPEGATDLAKITLDYSYYIKPVLEYNSEDSLYYRSQFGNKHIDASNNQQLAFKNIIIQNTSIWRIKTDPLGCMDMALNTDGDGMYITNGKMIPITWEKTGHYSPTKYYNEDGSALFINPGKTFISVYPIYRQNKIVME